ncbi:hypothetical protein LCGC14_0353270 [marine sediment metagenome]|uniref:Uncharacterized protein n=1 Tax=marine sediment metagenome TaxID=412755 RepID=A0A0F9TA27_9ZZZZ
MVSGLPKFAQTIVRIAGDVFVKSAAPLEIQMGDTASADASGRWRTSEPKTVFDSKLLGSDKQPLFWDEALESGAGIASSTPTPAKPYLDIVSSDATAGVFTRQTFRRFNYQPGKSHYIEITGVLELASAVLTGCERRIGYFDDDNGIFFESDAGVIGVTVRSNDTGTPIDTTFTQANWNVDAMDGNGVSGLTVDFTKGLIFVFDFEWFSQGRVRFGIKFGNMIRYVHNFEVGNVLTTPWASTPNLPLRYQMITTADSGICSMRAICSAVISEGGTDDVGTVRHVSTGGAAVVTAVENTLYALVGLRLKSTHFGATVRMINNALQIQTAAEFIEWVLVWNPDIAGAFTYNGLANSAIEFALGATANVVTNGSVIAGGYLETGGGNQGGGSEQVALENALLLGASIIGTPDEIVLAARPIGGVSAVDVEGSLSWRETF